MYLLVICVCVCIHACAKVREESVRVDSLLASSKSQGLNSGHQLQQQVLHLRTISPAKGNLVFIWLFAID